MNQALPLFYKDGMIYDANVRSMLISIEAFGMLRKDLIENIGFDRMKAFFFRYGWNIGFEDGAKTKSQAMGSLKEQIEYGPTLHSLKGYVQAEKQALIIEQEGHKVTHFFMSGLWRNSYEALEHVQHLGLSSVPVCFTLTGYASGYVSRLINDTVIFKETKCVGTGHEICHFVGKLVAEWEEGIVEELGYCKELPILRELEIAHHKLLEEKNNLAKVTVIHKRLTEEVIQGHHLDSLVRVMFEEIHLPVLIENKHYQPLAYEGIKEEQLQQEQEEFKNVSRHYLQKTKCFQTKNGKRLVSPVFLQGEKVGYCSIFLGREIKEDSAILNMFIERMSSVCSLVLLNEKTKFESTERMKGRFLEEILNGKYKEKQEIVKRASFIQFNISDPFYVIVLKYQMTVTAIEEEMMVYEKIMELITSYCKETKWNPLIGQRSSFVVMLTTVSPKDKKLVTERCQELIRYVKKNIPEAVIQIGMSMQNEHILKANESYEEALTALRMTTKQTQVVTFDSLGIIGVFVSRNNEAAVLKVAESTLGVLYEDVDDKKMELLQTLYTFLLHGGNLEQTADQLSLSVSGLRYRMSKIDQMLHCNLRDPEMQFQLLLSLKSLKLIGKLPCE